MSRPRSYGWFALALVAALPCLAQPVGGEFRVNTYTTRDQYIPSVALDLTGRFVVVWASDRQEGAAASTGSFGQRFAASGDPLGPEFRVNTYTTGHEYHAVVSSDAAGNFVVVWDSTQSQDGLAGGIFGQRYTESGVPLGGEFRINTYTSGDQREPRVAVAANGSFLVLWVDQLRSHVYGQGFVATGQPAGDEFRVNTGTTTGQGNPAVAADGNDVFIVAWADNRLAFNYHIFARRLTNAGQPLGPDFLVNTNTTVAQGNTSIAAGATGRFVITWSSNIGETGDPSGGIYARRFAADETPLGDEFHVNTYTTARQYVSTVASDATDNFVIVWQSSGLGQDGSGLAVIGRRYASTGASLGGEFLVNTTTTSTQNQPTVAAVPDGRFVAAWVSSEFLLDGSTGVFAKRYATIGPRGDANGDAAVNVSDILYLINHLFAGGPAPIGNADANGDGHIDVSDVLYLINYLFAGGPAPL